MFESVLLRHLIGLGGQPAAAAIEWLVNGGCPTADRAEVVWLSEPIRL